MMRRYRDLGVVMLAALLIAELALLWAVRRAPLGPLPLALADAPGAFVAAAVTLGLVLSLAAQPAVSLAGAGRALALALLAGAGALCATPLGAAGLLAGASLLAAWPALRARRLGDGLPLVLAGAALIAGGAALQLRGAPRYDDPAAGAALDSLVFWCALLAAACSAAPALGAAHDAGAPELDVLRAAMLLPLARLFALGPWNEGWSLAAALLGGAAALWAAWAALAGRAGAPRFLYGASLSALGLASSAGVAAGCYALLCGAALSAAGSRPGGPGWVRWAISGALPPSAPFIAGWMVIGAAAASGSTALAAALWVAALLHGVTILIAPPDGPQRRAALVAGAAAIALGVLAPAVVSAAIQPVVEQLQGGLTAHGNLQVAPWVGLALLDSGSRGVVTAPVLASALLMVVLAALCLLLSRLWPGAGAEVGADADRPRLGRDGFAALVGELRRTVPWLGRGRDDAG